MDMEGGTAGAGAVDVAAASGAGGAGDAAAAAFAAAAPTPTPVAVAGNRRVFELARSANRLGRRRDRDRDCQQIGDRGESEGRGELGEHRFESRK